MRNILVSLLFISAVGVLLIGATTAFFSDTEKSAGNTFTAGNLDLKVDYHCYFRKAADGVPNCPWQDSSWQQTDLGAIHKFFDFAGLVPGDYGEGTISLHILNNDAWGRLVFENQTDLENGCTEPEKADEPNCEKNNLGELGRRITARIWLDQGKVAGFQCNGVPRCAADRHEGDNIRQSRFEPQMGNRQIRNWRVEDLATLLTDAYDSFGCTGDGSIGGNCPGLASDGHLVSSITYFLGFRWSLPSTRNNEVQTDSFGVDLKLEAVQYRNNPDKQGF